VLAVGFVLLAVPLPLPHGRDKGPCEAVGGSAAATRAESPRDSCVGAGPRAGDLRCDSEGAQFCERSTRRDRVAEQ